MLKMQIIVSGLLAGATAWQSSAQELTSNTGMELAAGEEYHCSATSGGGNFRATITEPSPIEEGSRMHFELRACKKYIFPVACDTQIDFTVTGPYGHSVVVTKYEDIGNEVIQEGYQTVPGNVRNPIDIVTNFNAKQMSWRYIGITCWEPTEIWNKTEHVTRLITWKPKGLDTGRGKCTLRGNSCSAPGKVNCWRCDDESRDRLDMNWQDLTDTMEVKARAPLADGRYIYVLPMGAGELPGKLRLRRYDRSRDQAPNCANYYEKFRNPNNCRGDVTEECEEYLHVRHSQLNSGWEPLFAAGEMRVWDGKVEVVNNESGHFQPPAEYVERVCTVLKDLKVPVSPSLKCGDYRSYSAKLTDVECAQLSQ